MRRKHKPTSIIGSFSEPDYKNSRIDVGTSPYQHQQGADTDKKKQIISKQKGVNMNGQPDFFTDLLTTQQVADRLGITKNTLELWRSRNQGPAFIRLGSLVRYSADDINAYIEKQRVKL